MLSLNIEQYNLHLKNTAVISNIQQTAAFFNGLPDVLQSDAMSPCTGLRRTDFAIGPGADFMVIRIADSQKQAVVQ